MLVVRQKLLDFLRIDTRSSSVDSPILDLHTDRSVCTLGRMTTDKSSTVDKIFFAVMELILEGGLPAVTLSSVCKRAGISKGGLMHHYPSKEALVDAFVSRSSNECLNEIHEHLQPIAGGRGKRTKAFVDLMLKDPAMCKPDSSREIAAVMIALMQGQMVSHAEDFYERLAVELGDDGVSQAVIELTVTSVDGLWLQAAVLPVDRVARRATQIRLQLRRLIDSNLSNLSKATSAKNASKHVTKKRLSTGASR